MVVLGGVAVSYDRGTPVGGGPRGQTVLSFETPHADTGVPSPEGNAHPPETPLGPSK